MTFSRSAFDLDRESLLVRVPGGATLASVEEALAREGLSLGIAIERSSASAASASAASASAALESTVAAWLARGAPGAPSSFADPADHLVAGLTATLVKDAGVLEIRPSPRRAVGPDLIALCVGAGDRFASIDHVWLRVHAKDSSFPERVVALPVDRLDLDPPVSDDEASLLDAIAHELAR